MVFGLALVLALIFGLARAALSATGSNFVLGKANEATTVTKLTSTVAGPALTLVNQSTDAAATALNINVASGNAPLRVNAAAGTATNLSADELDGKDSSAFYAQGSKVADSSRADRADSAASASSAADADLLDGKDSSEFQASNPCPADTMFHEGACIETISQGPAAFPNAEASCLQDGRRLPTVAELQTFRLKQDLSGAEFTSHVWFDANGSSQTQKVMLVDQDGRQSVVSGSAAFRCVAAPGAARSENAPLEATAKSDLRNAASAATACAADNNEASYTNCGTIAQLEANGYQHASNVTLVITTATATRWVAQAQHDSGGSAYRFDKDTGQIVPIPRF
jgi:type IV pilus assembly protein PilA